MNTAMAQVGRLGHRVWQSVEYYMANYPTVRALAKWEKNGGKMELKGYDDTPDLQKQMKTAFEDQLVQKVMPKLRD